MYRLFPDKESLFVAVVDHCATRMRDCLADGAARAESGDPEAVLAAMADSYARLIADRGLLRMLMQANCAAAEPAIGRAVRDCYAKQVEYVRAVTGATQRQIQDFFARGFLCNAVVAMDAEDVDAPWARTLTHGLRHYPSPAD